MEEYNPWWFNEPDTTYMKWKASRVKWIPSLLEKIKLKPFSLHFLTGPRQVGKTTLLKLLIHSELLKGRNPKSIFYMSCDEVIDFRELGEILDTYLSFKEENNVRSSLIVIDEITFVDEWWRAVKRRIDLGKFSRDVIIISGSSSIDLLLEKERFPGRRGFGKDYVLHPLSFSEYLSKVKKIKVYTSKLENIESFMKRWKANETLQQRIMKAFNEYMCSGGFPLSVIDMQLSGNVSLETVQTYLNWMRLDWQRAGKNEKTMKEVVSAVLDARLNPVGWLTLAKATSAKSPATVESYIETLEKMMVAKTLYLITPDKRVQYRKNKKIHFTDPLIYRVLARYCRKKVYPETILESILAMHIARKYETYYWRNGTEVDVIALIEGKLIGFEAKTTLKPWRKPRFLKEALLLDKEKLATFLATLDTAQ